jgi:hypothetical protein
LASGLLKNKVFEISTGKDVANYIDFANNLNLFAASLG